MIKTLYSANHRRAQPLPPGGYIWGMVQLGRLMLVMLAFALIGIAVCGELFDVRDYPGYTERWQLRGGIVGALCGAAAEACLRRVLLEDRRRLMAYSLWEMLAATTLVAVLLAIAFWLSDRT